MKLTHTTALLFLSFIATPLVSGQVAVYEPLGAVGADTSFLRWNSTRQMLASGALESRPSLPGVRTRNVEGLVDALLRKHPRLLDYDPSKARELVIRRYSSNLGQLRGIMAESIFIDRNPEWEYVKSPNATQHDVTRPGPGKAGAGPVRWNGQIKYHIDGRPSVYAADMRKDYRAHRFFVPDDHVQDLRSYLRLKAEAASAAGDHEVAKTLYKDYGRVRPIGATSSEIDLTTRKAAQSLRNEKFATYTSFGAAVALGLGPSALAWVRGDISSNNLRYQIGRTTSLIGAGVATDVVLSRFADGALRGTIRGNVITGVALMVVETGWLLHDHGWRDAFYRPEFYEQLVGGIGGLTLGIAGFVGGTTLASETGILAPIIGTGVGALAGTVGYFGGSSATHFIIENIWPEMLRKHEREKLETIKSSLKTRIAAMQKL